MEQQAGGGPQGVPKKRPWTAFWGRTENPVRARMRCQTEIESPEEWSSVLSGAPGRPEKPPGTAIQAVRESDPRPCALPDQNLGFQGTE